MRTTERQRQRKRQTQAERERDAHREIKRHREREEKESAIANLSTRHQLIHERSITSEGLRDVRGRRHSSVTKRGGVWASKAENNY